MMLGELGPSAEAAMLPESTTAKPDMNPRTCTLGAVEIPALGTAISAHEAASFASQPLSGSGVLAHVTFESAAARRGDRPRTAAQRGELPFEAPTGGGSIGNKTLRRLGKDLIAYAEMCEEKNVPRLNFVDNVAAEPAAALATMRELLDLLHRQMTADQATVNTMARAMERRCENVPVVTAEQASRADATKRDELLLRRMQGDAARAWLDALVVAHLDASPAQYVRNMAPHLTKAEIEELLQASQAFMFVCSRLAQLGDCFHSGVQLLGQLKRLVTVAPPRQHGDVAHTPRSSADVAAARHALLVSNIKHLGDKLALLLAARRTYVNGDSSFDPRFLVFEYVSGWLLRKSQVELVRSMVGSAERNRSMVRQMLMGGGKTACVCPLLAMFLANGKSLTMLVVPNQLLLQSRRTLWRPFSSLVKKRVFTFNFTRATPELQQLKDVMEKFTLTRDSGGVLVSTPSAIKSLMLKFVELCGERRQGRDPRLVCMSRLLFMLGPEEGGRLIMDEIDLLLNPLRSELNFPLGNEKSLAAAPLRWDIVIRLMDAVLRAAAVADLGPAVMGQDVSVADVRIKTLAARLRQGFEQRVIQRLPHLVLLDRRYYDAEIRADVAEWVAYDLLTRHVLETKSGHEPHRLEVVAKYLQTNTGALAGDGPSSELVRQFQATYDDASLRVLTLCHQWVTVLLPHCLSKIDRFAYGLLGSATAKQTEARMSVGRVLAAVPFEGKDSPSRSSEFAHPDIMIGLTTLAYRYEGLRRSDMRRLLVYMLRRHHQQPGPAIMRPDRVKFDRWVQDARAYFGTHWPRRRCPEVPPLEHAQAEDPQVLDDVLTLLGNHPDAVAFYLSHIVLPQVTKAKPSKLSASGQELATSILFGVRLGFSGTPSALLPMELHLRDSDMERGSQGKMISVLTDPRVVSVRVKTTRADALRGPAVTAALDSGPWASRDILQYVATAEPSFNALIDTGALITGFTNREVAEFLLENGLAQFDACVYLDGLNHQMIVVRGHPTPMSLYEVSVPVERRFVFYDQIHHTGIDIDHAVNARAAVTMSKDMTLREYSQGCWRMRGIGNGQTVVTLLTPAVASLIMRRGATDASSNDVVGWLTANGVAAEQTQFKQLCVQNLAHLWRRRAWNGLLGEFVPKAKEREYTIGLPAASCLEAFTEPVSFDLAAGLTQPERFQAFVERQKQLNKRFLKEEEDGDIIRLIEFEAREAAASSVYVDENLERDVTQDQEREQQQEQERNVERDVVVDHGADSKWAPPTDTTYWPLPDWQEVAAMTATGHDGVEDVGFADAYPLAEFQVHDDVPCRLPFHKSLHVSPNFAARHHGGMKPRKLNNVNVGVTVATHGRSVTMLLTLREAETLRRYLQSCFTHVEAVSIHVTLREGLVLDSSSRGMRTTMPSEHRVALRFFDCLLWYSHKEAELLLGHLGAAPMPARTAFFNHVIQCRRRSQVVWKDTPLAVVFTLPSITRLRELREMATRLLLAVQRGSKTIEQVCTDFDENGDGWLSVDEITTAMRRVLPELTHADVADIVRTPPPTPWDKGGALCC